MNPTILCHVKHGYCGVGVVGFQGLRINSGTEQGGRQMAEPPSSNEKNEEKRQILEIFYRSITLGLRKFLKRYSLI